MQEWWRVAAERGNTCKMVSAKFQYLWENKAYITTMTQKNPIYYRNDAYPLTREWPNQGVFIKLILGWIWNSETEGVLTRHFMNLNTVIRIQILI